MQFSELTIKLLILFLPGLISLSFYQMLVNQKRLEDREFLVMTILNGFISHFPYSLFTGNYSFYHSLLDSNLPISFKEILIASVCGFFIGCTECCITNYGCIYKIASKLKITTKTGNISVWDELFDDNNKGISNYVYITMQKNNVIYAGTVDNYSVSAMGTKELILSNVDVYNATDRKTKLYFLHKIYLNLSNINDFQIEIGESYDNTKE